MFILAILKQPEFHAKLRSYTEKGNWGTNISEDTATGRRALSGQPDYLITHAGSKPIALATTPPDTADELILQGKTAMDDEAKRFYASGLATLS
ncbi:hypothetical protein HDV00_010513 [Rhizophlyctis rosea]|nr:hypothetical protein HDV00_010513 [Rhizophlyctis rosea]